MNGRTLTEMVVGFVLVGLLIPGVVTANDVAPGHDCFVTGQGSGLDFCGSGDCSPPIPADFFGPGSDPFDGFIALEGNPLGTFGTFGVGETDTIIERLDAAVLPEGGSATIDIELVALSLRSIAPITVTFNGGQDPQAWDVDVELSDTDTSVGTMTITHSDSRGGTYESVLLVYPKFTFTKVGEPSVFGEFDFGANGWPAVQTATTSPGAWEDGATNGQLVVPNLSGPDFYTYGDLLLSGMQPVLTPTPAAPIPTVSEWSLGVMLLLALTAGTILFARRRARPCLVSQDG